MFVEIFFAWKVFEWDPDRVKKKYLRFLFVILN